MKVGILCGCFLKPLDEKRIERVSQITTHFASLDRKLDEKRIERFGFSINFLSALFKAR